MKKYVIFDPLYERVVCAHEKAGMVCNKCRGVENNRGPSYDLIEVKRLIQKKG